MDPKPDDLILPFATSAAFDAWLAKHHAKAPLLWIKHAKKGSGEASITWTEAVDVALCYGWIDGQSKSVDARTYVQRYTPRRAKSPWSKINRDRVARLIEAGRMRPAGLAEVERAKADGRWDAANDSPKNAAVPDDLAAALAKRPAAKAAFEQLKGMDRYAILHRLMLTKRPELRARKIEAFIAELEAKAAKDAKPAKAAKPARPTKAAKPARPTKAAKAATPAKPAKAATPSGPPAQLRSTKASRRGRR